MLPKMTTKTLHTWIGAIYYYCLNFDFRNRQHDRTVLSFGDGIDNCIGGILN